MNTEYLCPQHNVDIDKCVPCRKLLDSPQGIRIRYALLEKEAVERRKENSPELGRKLKYQ